MGLYARNLLKIETLSFFLTLTWLRGRGFSPFPWLRPWSQPFLGHLPMSFSNFEGMILITDVILGPNTGGLLRLGVWECLDLALV